MRHLFPFQKNNSSEIARSRLKLLLISDKTHINPGMLNMIRDDMAGVLSRYAEVDAGQLNLSVSTGETASATEDTPVLSASLPIRQLTTKRNKKCF